MRKFRLNTRTLKFLDLFTKIVSTVIITIVLGLLGYCSSKKLEETKIAIQETQERTKIAITMLDRVFGYVDKAQLSDCSKPGQQDIVKLSIELFNESSRKPLSDDATARLLQNFKPCAQYAVSSAEPTSPKALKDNNDLRPEVAAISKIKKLSKEIVCSKTDDAGQVDGWVAVGRSQPTKFLDSNFVLVGSGRLLDNKGCVKQGAVMQTKWSVNLRQSTKDTVSGQNSILGILSTDQCVSTRNSVANVRGQTWALVKLIDCP